MTLANTPACRTAPERDGAFLGPLGEGLGKQVQAGDEEQDALVLAGDFLGDLEAGEGLAGAAGHVPWVSGLEAEVGADEFLEVAAFFALGLGGSAVFGENALEGTHELREI